MMRVQSSTSSIAHLMEEPAMMFSPAWPMRQALCGWSPKWPYKWSNETPPGDMRMCDECDRQYRQIIADEIKAG